MVYMIGIASFLPWIPTPMGGRMEIEKSAITAMPVIKSGKTWKVSTPP